MPDLLSSTTASAPPAFELKLYGKPPNAWTLILHPDRMELVPPPASTPAPDAETNPWSPPEASTAALSGTVVLRRAEFGSGFWLDDGLVMKRIFGFRTPTGTRTTGLTPTAFRAVTEWVGPISRPMLGAELHRRTVAFLPAALLFVVTSMPCPGDASAGLASVPLQWMSLGLGLSLALIFLLARFAPHPAVYLLDAAWWTVLITNNVRTNLVKGEHWIWLVAAAVCLFFLLDDLRQFRRFSSTRRRAVSAPPGA